MKEIYRDDESERKAQLFGVEPNTNNFLCVHEL